MKDEPEHDARLVQRIAAGDRAGEAELVDRFYRRVYAMMAIRTRDRDAAGDLAQEALMAALGALRKGQLREPERLAGFVHGTARNVLNNFFRQRQRRGDVVELTPETASFEPTDPVEEYERLAALRRGLAELEAAERAILVLTLVEGLKPGQIAARLGLSAEVVRTRKSRALKRLTDQVRLALGEGRRG